MESPWKLTFQSEIENARTARLAGNEGMARVCARRAAGIVAGEYLSRSGKPSPGANAYDRLRLLAALPDIPQAVRPVLDHFLIRVTPDHTLPVEADLVREAEWMADFLLPE